MIFYSEDNKDMAISKLLSLLLDIRFCGTNSSLYKFIEDNFNNNSKFNVYFDVVPDNLNLNKMFNKLLSRQETEDNYDINIIPIPCTEYFIIKALYDIGVDFGFKYKWLNIVLYYTLNMISIGKPYPPKSLGYKESFRSFEKQCKLILENCSSIFLNFNTVTINDKNILELSWYLSDLYDIQMINKAIAIAHQYPVVSFKGCVPNGFTLIKDINAKAKKLQSDYFIWKNNFHKIELQENWWEADNVNTILSQLGFTENNLFK